MKRAVLYLLVGYPGSGKTTTSQIIHELTGAVHIWADYERRAIFGSPTHKYEESRALYDHLNQTTDMLLSDGQSVIFDTNFNFRKDRDLLRSIAATYKVETVLIWIKVDKQITRQRALSNAHASDNLYANTMTAKDFDRITKHLEEPEADEHPIILDGTLITAEYVAKALGIPGVSHHTNKSKKGKAASVIHSRTSKPLAKDKESS
jgi:predicted kinase